MELEDMEKERERAKGEKTKTVKDVLTSRCVRWQLLTLAFPCSLINFSGIAALFSYAFHIFHASGVPEDQMHYFSIGIGTTQLVSMIVASFFVDCVGRKKLIGVGYLLMGIIMSALTVTLSFKNLESWIPNLNIALIILYICIFGFGPAGGCMSLSADIFLQAWRPSAYVILGTLRWLSVFLVWMTFGYIVDGLGQYCFLFFVVYCILSAAFVLYFVPETKGKTIVKITDDFNKLNYKNNNTDVERADADLET